MNDQRNENGQFAKGHSGFKPVGAVKRKSNHELERLKELFDILDKTAEKDIFRIGENARINTMLNIAKLLNANKKKKKRPSKPHPQP